MHNGAYPLLRADGASLDWTSAAYSARVKLRGRSASATHELHDAPQLEALLADKSANWVLELRCPKTLLAKAIYDTEPAMIAHWTDADVDGELFITPGLVAVRALQLDAAGLNALWGDEPITVPVGRWLARGGVVRTKSLAASLLTFSPSESLTGGQMEVLPNTSSGDLSFNVGLSREHFAAGVQTRRDTQIAALIAAMGRIPHLDQGDGDSFPILDHIRDRLIDSGVPIWGDQANSEFDPARAATAIEEFLIPVPSEDEE